jgi:ATP-dependent RNA helicase RhlE
VNSFETSGTSRSNPHAASRPAVEGDGVLSPFAALGLAQPIVRATLDENYLEPTPVQREVIPAAVQGRDVLASAQTGTGKTAAFVLPILHQLANGPRTAGVRVLILTPTRELAAQIAERVTAYGRYLRFRHAVVYGGVSQFRQEAALQKQPELLVATPGRLLDLMGQGLVKLDGVAHFVLDEADRMLDMGFIHDVRRVIGALPKVRQTLFFSATVPRPIEALAASLLVDPVRVSVTPKITAAETVDQSVVFVTKEQKSTLLETLLDSHEVERAIVFTRTKHGADRLSRRLERVGIAAPAIHGNKSQNARERALAGFRDGKTRVLIATDIAARGIDVDGVSHVFNFDLPNVPESYVHRVGRTGRAGASGRAISFCDRDERPLLGDIERLLRRRLPVLEVTLPPSTDVAQSQRASGEPERTESARQAEPHGGPSARRAESHGGPNARRSEPHGGQRGRHAHETQQRDPSRHHGQQSGHGAPRHRGDEQRDASRRAGHHGHAAPRRPGDEQRGGDRAPGQQSRPWPFRREEPRDGGRHHAGPQRGQLPQHRTHSAPFGAEPAARHSHELPARRGADFQPPHDGSPARQGRRFHRPARRGTGSGQ